MGSEFHRVIVRSVKLWSLVSRLTGKGWHDACAGCAKNGQAVAVCPMCFSSFVRTADQKLKVTFAVSVRGVT
jgi:hypothetical protein